ncbi:ACP S-malonyltransferase [Wenzhouxiangella sp. AB-CW3]|uniref:ACP S-malonyltransferase n=1 Tax=Wenzhouxiangella sp. AB-CW3 TaxID=2771012 RepID=UPI00168AE7FC|nr:ACP S-malonyltransferase [Wenzhouxiangella sp. AB-CW3]QOC24000.1 ACP S-malonyltransferase [Wenzhouxiangella sp. AB-CW3]
MSDFAFIFPGQGSQSVGMLAELAERHTIIRETFDQAGGVLGLDLWQLVSQGPKEELDRTELTQPAILAASVGMWRLWNALEGPRPSRLAGHSLGEYSALVAAEALDFEQAVSIVSERGRQMQAAVPDGQGAMAAILGLDDDVVEAICREVAEGQVVAPANYNSPGQIVIAGDSAAVERAMHKCGSAGARRAVTLPVSVPSHSSLMQPAAEAMNRLLGEIDIQSPVIPVVHNCDVSEHAAPDEIRQALVSQLCKPVRWTESMRTMTGAGIMKLAECGPGRVLCGLGRRIERGAEWLALEQPGAIEETIEQWREQDA